MTADDKYSLLNKDNLTQPIQIHSSKNQKTFSQVFSAFLKSRLNVEHFQKKTTLIAYAFPKLQTAKDGVREVSKKFHFRRPFDKRYGKRSQTLFNSAGQHPYYIYWSLWKQMSWKKYLLVIWKILRLLVNTFTADDKYSVLKRGNLTQPIQIHLSKNWKTFS